jgi:HPt (histidine-containing phosphotransfer) domain-containing protein
MVQREYTTTTNAPIFDSQMLDEFCATVGHPAPILLRGIVYAYLSDTPETIAQIADALEADDPQRAAELLHRLKGSSLSIGALHMAHECVALEHHLITVDALRRLGALAAAYERAAVALKAYLAERGPQEGLPEHH